jgi:hypothetical protein
MATLVMGGCCHVIIPVGPNRLIGSGMKWSLHERYAFPGNKIKEQGKLFTFQDQLQVGQTPGTPLARLFRAILRRKSLSSAASL